MLMFRWTGWVSFSESKAHQIIPEKKMIKWNINTDMGGLGEMVCTFHAVLRKIIFLLLQGLWKVLLCADIQAPWRLVSDKLWHNVKQGSLDLLRKSKKFLSIMNIWASYVDSATKKTICDLKNSTDRFTMNCSFFRVKRWMRIEEIENSSGGITC